MNILLINSLKNLPRMHALICISSNEMVGSANAIKIDVSDKVFTSVRSGSTSPWEPVGVLNKKR